MAKEDRDKFKRAIGQIIAAAWDDPGFLTSLVNAGDQTQLKAAVQAKGIDFPSMPGAPENTAIRFVANTEDTRYMVIPLKPKFSDMDIGLLAQVRQLQVWECCCDRSFVEMVQEMVGEAADAARTEEAPDQG